jgi:hypothetical protein
MTAAISIAALALSALAVTVSVTELIARRRAVRAEQTDRLQQLELLQKEVARTKRADIAVNQTNAVRWMFSSEYEFRLTNVGQAFARDVRAVLLDADGATSLSTTMRLPQPLASGESTIVKLKIPHVPRHDPPAVLAYFWSDEDGEQSSGFEVRQHAS